MHIRSRSYKSTSQFFSHSKQVAKEAFFLLLFGFVLPINLCAQDNTAILNKASDVYEENESLSHPDHPKWNLLGEIPEAKLYYNSETINVENNSVIVLFKEEYNEEKKLDYFDEPHNGFVFVRLINCEKNEYYEIVRDYYLDNEKLESFSGGVVTHWDDIKPGGIVDLISKNVACI